MEIFKRNQLQKWNGNTFVHRKTQNVNKFDCDLEGLFHIIINSVRHYQTLYQTAAPIFNGFKTRTLRKKD